MGTPSTMQELGAIAPDFSLPDFGADGKLVSKKDFQSAPGLLVIFLCNHCPYVHRIREALADFAREYQPKGLAIVAINANDVVSYPEDSPDKMAEEAADFGYIFPYLFDETQEIAKAYRAACTPDFFLFDKAHKLVYRGQFDDSRPKNNLPATGADLRAATDALLSGKTIDPDQKPGFGCNIKWKEDNEPDYFRSIRLKPSLEGTLEPKTGDSKWFPSGWSPKTSEAEEIGEYVYSRIRGWLDDRLTEKGDESSPALEEDEFRERMDRVEEELRHQRESMKQAFELTDRRIKQVDKRVSQVDKRLDQMDKRLDAIDKRFESLTRQVDRFMIRSFAITLGIAIMVMIVMKMWWN
uniref:Peroxiredoxin n=1 Tax=Candidatus Kentrum sp. MB TaxID=2138164 RepID=A0A450X3V9_9GAMM|nr:MAG: Peroxiredoxin [Candidatus Kentron sp. MB]